ncbi:MAG: hypothetical protein Ct9H90mP16_15960 [Candidatus Poseidoniales archaeon]|nr:MAG: hypothetical protein Ct9H90mP16_15960 [Candidatus Poseidoniales archaeon]
MLHLTKTYTSTDCTPPLEAHSGSSTDVATKVVEGVVKHTGYPADFIELDQDLEGELGNLHGQAGRDYG